MLATGNAGKVRELQGLLRESAYMVIPQVELGVTDVAETGITFIENALLKARHAAEVTGLPAIADDSGLCVDALNGAPGIYSARYAGTGATDADNIAKLLTALSAISAPVLSCRFVCVMAYLRHAADPRPILAEGVWEGCITLTPRGSQGFGYDPIFEIPALNQTAAELPAATKEVLSHRGQALRKLVAALG